MRAGRPTVDDGAGCRRRRHQIRLRLPPRSTPLRHKTRRGWGGGYRGMRFSWLRVIADCHFSVIRKKIFSTSSLAVARIRNRTARGGRARGRGLNCTRAPRRRPSPSPPCSSIPWFVKERQIFGSVTMGQMREKTYGEHDLQGARWQTAFSTVETNLVLGLQAPSKPRRKTWTGQ